MRAGERVAVKVLVDNHWHQGRRCSPGEIIHLHEVQLRQLGNRVQRPPSAPVADEPLEVSPAKVESPGADSASGDDDGGGEDPDPEPEPALSASIEVGPRRSRKGRR
jgi:hypothetical protein